MKPATPLMSKTCLSYNRLTPCGLPAIGREAIPCLMGSDTAATAIPDGWGSANYKNSSATNPSMKPDTRLAIDGGQPVRRTILPYGHQWLDEEDIASVVEVLRSPWLTTGPKVDEFEQSFARFVGTREAVAVSSGTAALHSAMYALGIGPGDEVIVPAMTFAATANSVVFQGGTPVFADVDNDTLLLNSADVEAKITARTKAIIAVDYAGQPCNYDALRALASEHNLGLLADACHSLGA